MALMKLTSELTEGMVTAEPIINNFGQTLLPAAMEIRAKHIEMLKLWNVQAVYVKSDEQDDGLVFNDEVLQQSKELLFKRLAWEPRNALEEDLIELGIMAEANTIIKRGSANAK